MGFLTHEGLHKVLNTNTKKEFFLKKKLILIDAEQFRL